jgi:V8-like Glu-specific endopeptidase
MAVNPLQFMGQYDRPLLPEEMAQQRPVLGSGERPRELAEFAARRRIYVRLEGDQPARPTAVRASDAVPDAAEVAQGVWRIELPVAAPGPVGLPGRTASRREPAEILAEVDAAVDFRGYRPDWIDQLFVPRIMPTPSRPLLRRLDGRRMMRPEVPFPPENRTEFMDSSYPWGVIGRVDASDGFYGTGCLIGPRIMVTAGHVVPWGDVAAGSWSMRFVPAYYNGQSLHGAGVESWVSDVQGFNTSGSVTGYDWAVCRLYDPLGDWFGFMGFNGWSDSWIGGGYWTNVGYQGDLSGGARPTYQTGIPVFDTDSDSAGGTELEHRGDTAGGNSGGPFFASFGGDFRLVGVHSGYEEDVIALPPFSEAGNVAAGGSGFTNLVAWARTNWP